MEGSSRVELYDRAKKMIVKAGRLKISPESIENSKALFGVNSLGLDSLDALELVIAIEKEFGARIPSADVGKKVLASVDTIVSFVEEKANEKSS